jgi:hypothetical protein
MVDDIGPDEPTELEEPKRRPPPTEAETLPAAANDVELELARRLQLHVYSVPSLTHPVTVLAGELLTLVAAFWREGRRADLATQRLEKRQRQSHRATRSRMSRAR